MSSLVVSSSDETSSRVVTLLRSHTPEVYIWRRVCRSSSLCHCMNAEWSQVKHCIYKYFCKLDSFSCNWYVYRQHICNFTFAAFTVANLDVSISRSCPQVGNLEFRLKHNRLKNSPTWVCPAASHKSVCCSIKSGSDDVLWCFMASTVQCAICVTVCIICV